MKDEEEKKRRVRMWVKEKKEQMKKGRKEVGKEKRK